MKENLNNTLEGDFRIITSGKWTEELKLMKPGETCLFPKRNRSTVSSTVYRLNDELGDDGLEWDIPRRKPEDKNSKYFKVTKVS